MSQYLDTQNTLKQLESEDAELKANIHTILEQQKQLMAKLDHNKNVHKALTVYADNVAPPQNHVPQFGRHGSQPISDEVKRLIVDNVYSNENMSWDEAAKTYNVSCSSIYRIVKNEKKRCQSEENLQNSKDEPKLK